MSKKFIQIITLSCCFNFPLLADSLFDNCCGIYGAIQREMNASELKEHEVMTNKYMTSTDTFKRPNIFSD